jgi:ABC-type lipoprotein export system ATPase subunit
MKSVAKELVLGTNNVRKRYKIPGHPAIEILKGVNFSVFAGEKVAIIGRSGSGKSTLLNILGGLVKPTKGTVTRPKNIGFVFQSYHLMPELTVLENVILPTMARRAEGVSPAAVRARAEDLLSRVGLSARLHHLPAELSGGEMQRVALARALITEPALVLADEPTGNLDALTGAEILKILSDLSVGSSVALVMVTHSPEAAAICDRVLTLSDGVLTGAS